MVDIPSSPFLASWTWRRSLTASPGDRSLPTTPSASKNPRITTVYKRVCTYTCLCAHTCACLCVHACTMWSPENTESVQPTPSQPPQHLSCTPVPCSLKTSPAHSSGVNRIRAAHTEDPGTRGGDVPTRLTAQPWMSVQLASQARAVRCRGPARAWTGLRLHLEPVCRTG